MCEYKVTKVKFNDKDIICEKIEIYNVIGNDNNATFDSATFLNTHPITELEDAMFRTTEPVTYNIEFYMTSRGMFYIKNAFLTGVSVAAKNLRNYTFQWERIVAHV